MKLYGDLETFSPVPIKHGVHAYAEKAEILLFTYAIDHDPVRVVDFTDPDFFAYPDGSAWEDLCEALLFADEIIFHNSHFDRTVGRLAKNSPLPFKEACANVERWRDTMVRALAHGLPGALETLCAILEVPADKIKDKRGKALIQRFCKPDPKLPGGRATRETHPNEWAEFIEYAKSDIEAMREVDQRLPNWNYRGAELELWHLDQRINDRGFLVDLDLANAAIKSVEQVQAGLAVRAQDLTNGEVQAATQRDAVLLHILSEYGIDLADLQSATVKTLLKDAKDLPPELVELLNVRLQASSTSVAKYKTLVNGVSSDGYLRGTLQFCGAARTGRWSGRLFQPQNLLRPPKYVKQEWELAASAIKSGAVDLVYHNPTQVIGALVRGVIIAPPDKKLVAADLSNIEGRGLAFEAGEDWKLRAFRDFDAGVGPDLYKLAYAKSFRIHPGEVDDEQRQIGKVQELMLGYGGGVGAFLTGAATYGFDVEDLGHRAIDTIPDRIRQEATQFYLWSTDKKNKGHGDYGLSQQAFVVCDSLKRMWREAHPNVVSLWEGVEAYAKRAVAEPGATLHFRGLKFRRDGAWLRIGLPSGRVLCYPQPKLEDDKLSYMGINQYSRKWQRLHTYGGKLVENITQALARDVMAHNMPTIEEAGYEIVLTVHDEVLCYAPDTPEYGNGQLSNLLATVPEWAEGLPLAAAGFEAYRYRKD